jgi:predicted xylose isomerase-like sugar epimerase
MGRHWPDEIAQRRRVKRAERSAARDEVVVETATDDDIRAGLRDALDEHGLTRAQVNAESRAGRYSSEASRQAAFMSAFARQCGLEGEP